MSLLNEGLDSVPHEAWSAGPSARVLELSGNRLVSLPAEQVSQLTRLRLLRASANQLSADGMPWSALAALTRLTSLVLDSNPCVPANPSDQIPPGASLGPRVSFQGCTDGDIQGRPLCH